MPIESVDALTIVCDNPDCPGNDLDPATRTGWLFVTSEVYGQPVQQTVFCCVDCVSVATAKTPALLTGPDEVSVVVPVVPS